MFAPTDFGFVVEFEDGSTFAESQGTWDEVPRDKRIKSVSLANLKAGQEVAKIHKCARYYFSNVAADSREFQRIVWVGKLIGAVRENGTAVELRLHFDKAGMPVRSKHELMADSLPYTPETYREGTNGV